MHQSRIYVLSRYSRRQQITKQGPNTEPPQKIGATIYKQWMNNTTTTLERTTTLDTGEGGGGA